MRGQGRFLRIARDIMHRGRHLIHCGGDLFGFLFLRADFEVGLFCHRRQRLGGSRQLLDTRLQAADNMTEPRAHLLHCLHQLTDFVTAGHVNGRTQIPRGNLLRHLNHTAQRCHDQPGDEPRGNQPDQQGQGGRANDQQRVLFQFSLHRLVLRDISLIHPLDHLGCALV
ncbi:hypothetical protein D3C86_1084280 [compost metagenome]